MATASLEGLILQTLDKDGIINDSGEFASTSGYDHKEVVGSIKSLQSYEMIVSKASLGIQVSTKCRPYRHFKVSSMICACAGDKPLQVCSDEGGRGLQG